MHDDLLEYVSCRRGGKATRSYACCDDLGGGHVDSQRSAWVKRHQECLPLAVAAKLLWDLR